MALDKKFDRFCVAINGKNTGTTTIGKPLNDFVITDIRFLATNIAVLVALCTASVGTNDTDYNNVSLAAILTNILATNDLSIAAIVAGKGFVAAGTDIKVKVTIGANATTADFLVEVIGYYSK